MRQERMITVIDVLRRLNIPTTPKNGWLAGDAVRDKWLQMHHNAPPIKDNRKKTNGTGSHCFALYPYSFLPYMEAEILKLDLTHSKQPDFFSKYRDPKDPTQDLFLDW